MSTLPAALKRFPTLVNSWQLIQRYHTRPFSTSPVPPSFINSSSQINFHRSRNSYKGWVYFFLVPGIALVGFGAATPPHSLTKEFLSSFGLKTDPTPVVAEDDDDDASDHVPYPRFLLGDAFRRKVFFKYEKRIRMRSPPEKIFDYFASVRSRGGICMTPADLMRAVVPVFPPSESHLVRDGYLRGERSPGELRCDPSEFFMLFDTNGDGLISFKEYIFFVTLLGIPESSFSVAFKMFDIDCNGEIDRGEFKRVMNLMRVHNRQGAIHRDGLRCGIRVGDSVENGGLVEYFFGKDGKTRLQHEKFVQFLRSLHAEMIRLEFAHYDFKRRGTILAKDFALSMVASADMRHLNKLLKRVDEVAHESDISNIRITFDEFKAFAELRKRLQPFSLALFCYGRANGLLTRKDFQRAASQVCGVSLTDNVVEVIFHVFDTNRDGNLSAEEFIRVLQKREWDIAQPTEAGVMNFLSCCWNCASNCSTSRSVS